MGLDITHYKATMEKAEFHTLFYIGNDIYGETGAEIREHFDSFNVDFDHFRKYVQLIDVPTIVETVIIVKGIENLKKAQDHFGVTERTFIVQKDKAQLQRKLNNFERKNGHQSLQKNFNDVNSTEWIILEYYSFETKEGFYFKRVGQQRKGMNENFSKKFCTNDKSNFVHRRDFDYAYSCVDHSRENETEKDVQERRKEFKKEFINNFEFGASFMAVSY